MASRELTMAFHEDFSDVTISTTQQVHNAIGYLTTWAINGDSDRYKGKMSLYGDKEGNLHGTYRNVAGDVTYNLFGQRDEKGEYSFHS